MLTPVWRRADYLFGGGRTSVGAARRCGLPVLCAASGLWALWRRCRVSRAVSRCCVGQARFPARSPGRPSVSGLTRSG